MNLSEIKFKLKKIKPLDEIYQALIGKPKLKRICEQKRQALQAHSEETFAFFEKVLSGNNIKYFLNFGSLLGIIRDGKVMDYDLDIDYGIFISRDEDWDKLEKVLTENGAKKERQFMLDDHITDQTYEYMGVSVDFFGHYTDGNYSYEYTYVIKHDCSYSSENEMSAILLKMYNFVGIKKMKFGDTVVSVPDEPEKYLASIYTENWRIPDPNWISENGPAWNELPDKRGFKQKF